MKTRLRLREELIIVPARLFGPAGDSLAAMILDTGSTRSSIREGILRRIGYEPDSSSRRMQLTTGSATHEVPILTIAKLRTLGIEMQPFQILSHELPLNIAADGVLGLDFFRGRKLTLDFGMGEMILE